MGRPPREYAEGIYHIASHGSDERQLFHDADDRKLFLDHLELTYGTLGLAVVSYVLMGNHYHTLTHTPDARLSRALQTLHGGYSLHHNRRRQRSAHLFRAHCVARRIRDDDDLLATVRYLALNPIEVGLVLDPTDWPWSSARAHAGVGSPPILLDEAPLRAALGDRPGWRRRYAELIGAGQSPAASERPPGSLVTI
jgi:REP element-mobilizing transposase RayT